MRPAFLKCVVTFLRYAVFLPTVPVAAVFQRYSIVEMLLLKLLLKRLLKRLQWPPDFYCYQAACCCRVRASYNKPIFG
jgi:hypothetical protein